MSNAHLLHVKYATYVADPLGFARDVLGFQPSAKQAQVLNARVSKGILCCTRGFGKTEITAILAVWHMIVHPGALVLVVSETAEKAAVLVQRVFRYLEAIGVEVKPDKLRKNGYCLENGARILPVANRPGAVRGYRATMILVDEAAVVPDSVWVAISGTRATTFKHARVWIMSTPGARKGFFFNTWHSTDVGWARIHATAYDCEYIDREFIEESRLEMHEDDFAREFLAQFCAVEKELFRIDDWRGRVVTQVQPICDPHTLAPPPPSGLVGRRCSPKKAFGCRARASSRASTWGRRMTARRSPWWSIAWIRCTGATRCRRCGCTPRRSSCGGWSGCR